MRLLNIETLRLETFYGSDVPEYIALSHTWGDDEVTFQDLETDLGRKKKGWIKIFGSAKEAKKYCCKYVWVDTCCIDKSSSAELSEAINSMFRWYRKSKVCVVHLEDVSKQPEPKVVEIEPDSEPATPPPSPLSPPGFHQSRWFRRGWTLQELIAPKTLYFYDSAWNNIGEKGELEQVIWRITGIDLDVLRDHDLLHTKGIARRFSWASQRETTRIEDIAYCLMGIFSVNMPLHYGEGKMAFIRLQEEIMRSRYDHSLFAWSHHFSTAAWGSGHYVESNPVLGLGILAPHPDAFTRSAGITPHSTRTEPYTVTNRGIQIHLRILEHDRHGRTQDPVAILQCGDRRNIGTAIAIPLKNMSAFGMPELKDEFCRAPHQEFNRDRILASRIFAKPRRSTYVKQSLSLGPAYPNRCIRFAVGYVNTDTN